MTDTKQPASGAAPRCPDFESLSCYADGELEPAVVTEIAAHLSACSHCATLAAQLREGFEADHALQDGGIGGSGCAGEEHLVVYATGGTSGAERAMLHAHLSVCDACIRALTLLHRRLGVAAVVDTPVPEGVQRRARLAFEVGSPALAPAVEPAPYVEPRGAALLDRLRGLLRVPILVPAAVAAGALLTVAVQPGRVEQPSGERGRAVAPDAARLRVTAVEAIVRSRPSNQSEVVATVHRGTLVDVAGEERDWYEVRLDGGRPGWVEREAFE